MTGCREAFPRKRIDLMVRSIRSRLHKQSHTRRCAPTPSLYTLEFVIHCSKATRPVDAGIRQSSHDHQAKVVVATSLLQRRRHAHSHKSILASGTCSRPNARASSSSSEARAPLLSSLPTTTRFSILAVPFLSQPLSSSEQPSGARI